MSFLRGSRGGLLGASVEHGCQASAVELRQRVLVSELAEERDSEFAHAFAPLVIARCGCPEQKRERLLLLAGLERGDDLRLLAGFAQFREQLAFEGPISSSRKRATAVSGCALTNSLTT
jgi:hypothetical protein